MPFALPRPSRPTVGVVLYLTGIFLFALNDALGKWLVKDYGVGQLMLLRSLGAGAVLLPMVFAGGRPVVSLANLPLQGLRIICMACDTYAFYLSTRYLPLADVMTFYMAGPLIITALSVPLLGERVEGFRWIAVSVGFIGVLIALRPTAEVFTPVSLIALSGATMYALGQTVTRKLRGAHWLPLVFWQFVGTGLFGAATTPFEWLAPSGFDLILMFVLGVVAMICFICLTRALAITRASVLAPLQYSSILWATLMGWIVWRDTPTLPILAGNAIIIGSGLYVATRRPRAPQEAFAAE